MSFSSLLALFKIFCKYAPSAMSERGSRFLEPEAGIFLALREKPPPKAAWA